MNRVIRCSLVAAALVVLAASSAFAQAGVKDEVQNDWTRIKDTMMKISAAMPEDKLGFKATPAQRSYSEQILHVAGANVNFLKALGGSTAVPTLNLKATSKADILKALEASFDYGTALIGEQTDASMMQKVEVPFIGASTKPRVFYFLSGHAWDIYGQLAVYLRLNGLVPPASVRP
jgi:hypothetical protein